MEKLHEYQGFLGRIHEWRDSTRNRYQAWREEHPETVLELIKTAARKQSEPPQGSGNADYSHVYRTKTRSELIRVSSAVMGIEFSYAAETAFVSPTLLKIGVEHQHMTLVWALSPLVGFFVTPLLGSVSDRCRLNLGRRRPFIILLSIGVFLGLLLVPNGEEMGYSMGDFNPYENVTTVISTPARSLVAQHASTLPDNETVVTTSKTSHPWGIFFTILGTVLLDFDADACQSPARAYLLDVTIPEDHAKGLSTFTIMAGLGGFMGYSLGGINWDVTLIGQALGGHVKAVFTLITFIFIICVSATITSFKEIPLSILEAQPQAMGNFNDEDEPQQEKQQDEVIRNENNEENTQMVSNEPASSYGALEEPSIGGSDIPRRPKRPPLPPLPLKPEYSTLPGENIAETTFNGNTATGIPVEAVATETVASLTDYLLSIVYMPHSLRMVCLTNLFCWMAHVCYSLYFTDFVGEAVFGGDPTAAEGSVKQKLYEEGVRFGCWGMAMYSLSCACYSLVIEKLILIFKAKRVYIGGLLFYCVGMTLMAMTRARFSVIIFSWGAGVMYSTLFTMPYLLVAHYHAQGVFEVDATGEAKLGTSVRGLGTDVAIVSSMVFLAQFILSICMGTIVSWSGTTTAVVSVASFLSFCGACAATQVMYLDL